MRRGRGSWWWAQIQRGLVYLALGIMSAGLALWVSSQWLPFAYPSRVRYVVFVLTLILGMLLFDLRIKSEIVTEEEIEK